MKFKIIQELDKHYKQLKGLQVLSIADKNNVISTSNRIIRKLLNHKYLFKLLVTLSFGKEINFNSAITNRRRKRKWVAAIFIDDRP